jgi:hypothetical protein
MRKAGVLILEALLNILLNATANLIGRDVSIRITRWGWLIFLLHATYLFLSSRHVKKVAVKFRSGLEGKVMLSYSVVAVLGAAIAIFYWVTINRVYAKIFSLKDGQASQAEKQAAQSVATQPQSATSSTQGTTLQQQTAAQVSAQASPQVNPSQTAQPTSKDVTDQTNNQLAATQSEPLPLAGEAESAAEHYRRTSVALKREEIREAYKEYCDGIANRFNLTSWASANQLTRMVTTNMGDTESFERAEKEFPATAWVAIRVLVAFETKRERPMYMSYVFIGRTPDGVEIVALFDASKQWAVLSRSSDSNSNPEQLMVETIKHELGRLAERIAPDIRRLG